MKKRYKENNNRIYICHTFYHVYVACLKEFGQFRNPANKDQKFVPKATLVLSKMSNNFCDLAARAKESGIFKDVIEFDEKDYTFFPELVELKKDRGSSLKNLLQRIKFCKRMGQLEEEYIPVDFTKYDDIYVFCDSDPIGYYLAYKKIRYHAVEDGLNCLVYRDTAYEDNKGNFKIKKLMAALGIIFIQNGYSKYCIDMEVNDSMVLDRPIPKLVEVEREWLIQGLTDKDKEIITKMFIANIDELSSKLASSKASGKPIVLILSEPLCQDLEVRKKLFKDMINEHGNVDGKEAQIVIKPHPRDLLDYEKEFSEHIILDSHFPMEILNFIGAEFDKVVTVYTVPSSIHCAKEKVYLGNDWMDRYEDPSLHAKVSNAGMKVTK